MSDEETEVERSIRASDLLKLMGVVEAAAGLFNFCEHIYGAEWGCVEFRELGQKLRVLGLSEVTGE